MNFFEKVLHHGHHQQSQVLNHALCLGFLVHGMSGFGSSSDMTHLDGSFAVFQPAFHWSFVLDLVDQNATGC